MKISGQKLELTLPVFGREMTFSEEELIAILEKNFSSEAVQPEPENGVIRLPAEGEWFEVNPLTINQKLFEKERKDSKQERTRLLILEAFVELRNNPIKYARKFETLIPRKTWKTKQVFQLEDVAKKMGDRNANWVEQALEWAQRICNGESWQAICNDVDTNKHFRLVKWKNGRARLIGGSTAIYTQSFAPSDFGEHDYSGGTLLEYAVPLVVRYRL